MGIFNFTDPKSTAQPSSPTQITLPQNILASLNLTPQDIESYHTGIIEKESTEEGSKYYKDNASNIVQAPPVKLGEIALSPKIQDKSDLVESIYTQIEGMEGAMESTLKPDSLKLIKAHLLAFSKGYAQAALSANDWQTAIKSFDKVTEGGITQNTEVVTALGNAFKDNLEIRVQIAELIQDLFNKRGTKISSQQVKTPEPTPTSIPEEIKPGVVQTQEPTPQPTPSPQPVPQPLASLKPQNPQDIPLAPVINLAQDKPSAPITTQDGTILRPVPVQNPNLTS